MAVTIKFNVEIPNCKNFNLKDTIGVYHVTENPYGWGTTGTALNPNNITGVKLKIFNIEGTLVNSIDLFSQFNINTALTSSTFTYSNLQWSYDDSIYKFILEYHTASDVYSNTLDLGVFCKTQCCLNKKWLSIIRGGKYSCDNKTVQDLIFIESLLYGMLANASCINITEYQNIQKLLNKFCNFKNCKC
jgi:hypothetical protein